MDSERPIKSERPTMEFTASVFTGCTANAAAAMNAGRTARARAQATRAREAKGGGQAPPLCRRSRRRETRRRGMRGFTREPDFSTVHREHVHHACAGQ